MNHRKIQFALMALVYFGGLFGLCLPSAYGRCFLGQETAGGLTFLDLNVDAPELSEFKEVRRNEEQLQARWTGKLGSSNIVLDVLRLDFSFTEPDEVPELVLENMRDDEELFQIREQSILEGPYGAAPFASTLIADLFDADSTQIGGRMYLLGGLLSQGGYAIQVSCRPPPVETTHKEIMNFLKTGIRFTGAERDPEWTLNEVKARWVRDTPDRTHEAFLKGVSRKGTAKKFIIRTKNYLIMTNSSSGKLFAKKMEENYAKIVKIYPFAQVEGRKLMPIFLFRTPEEYYDFYVKVAGASKESAKRSKGHAWKDYYATWYEAPADPVHIHEATHQIFKNRLYLNGGGSWFQEGVAEYIEAVPNDLNYVARRVEKGEHTPLVDFVQLKSLLYSSKKDSPRGGNQAGDHYKQAALLIEFLRESKFGRKKFSDFVHAMGKVPRGNLKRIQAVFRDIYGVTLDELEQKWQSYCAKR